MDVRKWNFIKRRKRYFSIHLETPPRKKKTTPNMSKIQSLFIAEMKRRGLTSFIRDIAVEIVTFTSDRRAPGIAAWAKNLIDIMHKVEYLNDPDDRHFLPFVDDRQIRYLFVKYVFTEGESSSFVRVRPFSSFVSDVHFLGRKEDHDEDFDFLDNKEDYGDLVRNKAAYVELFSERAYDAMHSMSLERMQRGFGRTISISPVFIRTCFPKRTQAAAELNSVYNDWTETLLSASIAVKLPGLPSGPNGSGATVAQKKAFKEEVRERLAIYVKKYTILKRVQFPAIVSVIYRPSKSDTAKDVDNVMLEYLIPSFNEIFVPPASPFRLKQYEVDGEKRLPVLEKEMVGNAIGYEVLRIPPKASKKEPGEVHLGFRLDYRESLMDKCDEVIDDYLNSDDGHNRW